MDSFRYTNSSSKVYNAFVPLMICFTIFLSFLVDRPFELIYINVNNLTFPSLSIDLRFSYRMITNDQLQPPPNLTLLYSWLLAAVYSI